MKLISILGATGSIGQSTLNVIGRHRSDIGVFAVSAHKDWKSLGEICNKYSPTYAVMVDEVAGKQLEKIVNQNTSVLIGSDALNFIASHEKVDMVMAAIVGSAGIHSSLAAIKANKRLMLANKESLVLAGDLFEKELMNSSSELIPVDSEHSAIFQCLLGGKKGLSKIQLTASGGPFLNRPIKDLHAISPEEACAHPNWDMGKKISVDSATMMNKGLEVIEAHYLFKLDAQSIDVVIHPQSIVHSSVYFKDGSVISQLGIPDMRTAISFAISYPERIESGVQDLNLADASPLEFFEPDYDKFRCLKLSFDALRSGGSAMGTLNAANEVAVSSFLGGQIKFLDIPRIIEETLSGIQNTNLESLDAVIENDLRSRKFAEEVIKRGFK